MWYVHFFAVMCIIFVLLDYPSSLFMFRNVKVYLINVCYVQIF